MGVFFNGRPHKANKIRIICLYIFFTLPLFISISYWMVVVNVYMHTTYLCTLCTRLTASVSGSCQLESLVYIYTYLYTLPTVSVNGTCQWIWTRACIDEFPMFWFEIGQVDTRTSHVAEESTDQWDIITKMRIWGNYPFSNFMQMDPPWSQLNFADFSFGLINIQ